MEDKYEELMIEFGIDPQNPMSSPRSAIKAYNEAVIELNKGDTDALRPVSYETTRFDKEKQWYEKLADKIF